ncbi:LysR family transcriptional regulator [Vibrio sp. SCSIO 43136]|uniref:LysR family transcriptional regulator n=1 Tax=Vibrio sp. SCSIO 43136 TaxID=2819101 RepID=UPI0020753FF3|nr:LysR family transcriptional regulator [Vibrio sp. SCSIO 43136]USD67181.1 LysR family transcriptional regulator [Vibrio sp. SCSIO 43136]
MAYQLTDIKALVTVAKLGSFTQAAEVLGVSRSHISRQVSQLEKSIGVTLLVRTTRSLKLTQAGEAFCSHCDKALMQIDDAVLLAKEETEQLQGSIRINCVGGPIGEEVIAPLVSQFMVENPNIDVSLDFSSHRIDLIQDEFDIALRMGELEDASFIARKVTSIQMSTLASPDYIASLPSPISSPSELTSVNCLVGTVRKWRYVHKDTQAEQEARVFAKLVCKNGRVLVQGAKAGLGVIRVPNLYCQAAIDRGELVEVFRDWQIPAVPFSVIYHKDRYQPKRLQIFIQYLLNYFV